MRRLTLMAITLIALTATTVAAQSRLEISGGAVFSGGVDFGRRNAELTPNVTSGTPTVFFRTDSSIEPAVGVQGRLGFAVTPSFTIEGGARFSRPVYRIRTSDDFEDAADVTADETFSDYVFDGSAVWHFRDQSRARTVPFVFGGAGYARALHDEASFVEHGIEYHAGGGIKWWLGSGPGRFGIRADAGVSIRERAFDLEPGSSRLVPVASGSLVWRF
jgi:hypothetical protein